MDFVAYIIFELDVLFSSLHRRRICDSRDHRLKKI
jgi:hypothetical protein